MKTFVVSVFAFSVFAVGGCAASAIQTGVVGQAEAAAREPTAEERTWDHYAFLEGELMRRGICLALPASTDGRETILQETHSVGQRLRDEFSDYWAQVAASRDETGLETAQWGGHPVYCGSICWEVRHLIFGDAAITVVAADGRTISCKMADGGAGCALPPALDGAEDSSP